MRYSLNSFWMFNLRAAYTIKYTEYKLSIFIGQKSIFHCYCIQNVKVRIQIQVYNINNEGLKHFSQFMSVKV